MCDMFCFQCEQTTGGTGCQGKVGACGKTESAAVLQDQLTGALMALAQTVQGQPRTPELERLMVEGMFTAVTNVSFDDERLKEQVAEVHRVREALAGSCAACASPCGNYEDYDMNRIWHADDEDVRSLKSMVLFGLRGMAAYAHHAMVLGYTDPQVMDSFFDCMAAIAEEQSVETLLELAMRVGEDNVACMALLDRANTETYGDPEPTTVSMAVEPGPFIVVTGHDLHDLYLLLEQTKDKGINIYTHSEMLPAHAYPKLKAYPHLKGNFGTAWQNQQKEFDAIPAPILYTTNCIMPVKASYHDRVFTTSVVAYPEMVHIGDDKDFTPVIEKALELGGYPQEHITKGINGGTQVVTGFGRQTVLNAAGTVVEAVKNGDIRHFFLVGGCDGARPGRNYYTEFVQQTPKDTVILTLACGKYRFNDLDLGSIGGLPRLLDMGQCNDAYGAVQVALALAKAFDCGVNELPLSLVISWYEQKAVCVLLSLLALGIKNIRLGPTLPAFVSPNVLNVLVEKFGIQPISTPEQDMAELLGA